MYQEADQCPSDQNWALNGHVYVGLSAMWIQTILHCRAMFYHMNAADVDNNKRLQLRNMTQGQLGIHFQYSFDELLLCSQVLVPPMCSFPM